MTRKDYVAIAQTISKVRAEAFNKEDALDRLTDEMSRLLKADNPRFDRERFVAACGVKP